MTNSLRRLWDKTERAKTKETEGSDFKKSLPSVFRRGKTRAHLSLAKIVAV